MSDDRALIEKTKSMILSDCLDNFFVSRSEIVKYLRKKKTGYMPFFNGCNSRLTISQAVATAMSELVEEGKAFKSGREIRKPYK